MAEGAVNAMVLLALGLTIVLVVNIVGSVLGARAYSINEDEINLITDANIKNAVKNTAIESFDAMQTNAEFSPLIVLGVVMGIVLMSIFSGIGGALGGRSAYGGGM